MHKRVFFPGQLTNDKTSFGLYLQDITRAILGTLDYATANFAEDSGQSINVNDVPSGWTLEKELIDPGATVFYGAVFKSPIADSPGKYKYFSFYMNNLSWGYINAGSAPLTTGSILEQYTCRSHDSLVESHDQSGGFYVDATVAHFVDINVSARHIAICTLQGGKKPWGCFERTRLQEYDSITSDYVPIVYTSTFTAFYTPNYRETLRDKNIASVGVTPYIGFLNWGESGGSFQCAYEQGGSFKTFLYTPTFANGVNILGEQHPDVPIYSIGTKNDSGDPANNLPSNLPGAEVTISGKRFVVVGTPFNSTDATPLYMEVR